MDTALPEIAAPISDRTKELSSLLKHSCTFWDPMTDLQVGCDIEGPAANWAKVGSWRAPCKGGAFPVGESPTRQPLQPEATGAAMEVTKWLKPSDKRVTKYGDSASVQAVT
ncbi:hypothetical protein [Cupriavidus necator]